MICRICFIEFSRVRHFMLSMSSLFSVYLAKTKDTLEKFIRIVLVWKFEKYIC